MVCTRRSRFMKAKKYSSITNIGKNPTFDLEHISVECHIFDFNKTIYGENLVIYFIEKIRDEIKFKDINQLKAQIKADCETAQQYLQKKQAYFLDSTLIKPAGIAWIPVTWILFKSDAKYPLAVASVLIGAISSLLAA